jgi:hypothetical protein
MSPDNDGFDQKDERLPGRIVGGWTAKVREINQKYKSPRLQMTPLVKFSLLTLRLYLILLVIILVYKFYTVVSFR